MILFRHATSRTAEWSNRHENQSGDRKGSIKRLHLLACITRLLFLSQVGNAYAAGPYDGEWNGSATAAVVGQCKPANVALIVLDDLAWGKATFDLDARNINGRVRPEGTFGGTIGFQHLTGKFVADKFEGTFRSFDCTWNLVLRRSRQPATSRRP